MEPLGLVALFALVLVKEIGLPLPPPMALVVVGSGILAARGDIEPVGSLTVIVVAAVIGATTQFLLVRHAARTATLDLLSRLGFAPHHVDRMVGLVARLGAPGVAIGRMIPGPRGVIVPAAGLARLPLIPFVIGFALGNTLYTALQFWLGMVAGQWALDTLQLDTPAVTIAFVVVTAVSWVAWLGVVRYRSRRLHSRRPAEDRPAPAARRP